VSLTRSNLPKLLPKSMRRTIRFILHFRWSIRKNYSAAGMGRMGRDATFCRLCGPDSLSTGPKRREIVKRWVRPRSPKGARV
jgi:hypothetical protein